MVYNEAINYFINHNQPIREWAIAGSTIALAIVAFLQVKASYRQISESRFQKRIEIHTEQLKKMIRVWEEEISKLNLKIDEMIISQPTEYKAEVENLPLFEDLKKHEPDDLDIFNCWEEYKNKILRWKTKKFNYFSKISRKITDETGLTLGMIPSEDNIFTDKLLIAIHSQISNKIKNTTEIGPIRTDSTCQESRGGKNWHSISTIAQSQENEQIENLKQFTTKLPTIVENEGWVDDFRIILDDYKQLINDDKKKLLYKIIDFYSVPLFSEECNYLKKR